MEIFDISMPLNSSTVTWPGDLPFDVRISGPGQDGSLLSQFSMGSHVGTHIDAPMHFLPHGKPINELLLEKLVGPCEVITVKSNAPEITLKDLKNHDILPKSRILFKTGNSQLLESEQFNEKFCSLSPEAAQFLCDRDVWLVGIDYLSIEPYHSPGHPIHKLLLSKDIVLLENIYLDHVPQGRYELICLPLKIDAVEAAPCRAILRSYLKTEN